MCSECSLAGSPLIGRATTVPAAFSFTGNYPYSTLLAQPPIVSHIAVDCQNRQLCLAVPSRQSRRCRCAPPPLVSSSALTVQYAHCPRSRLLRPYRLSAVHCGLAYIVTCCQRYQPVATERLPPFRRRRPRRHSLTASSSLVCCNPAVVAAPLRVCSSRAVRPAARLDAVDQLLPSVVEYGNCAQPVATA